MWSLTVEDKWELGSGTHGPAPLRSDEQNQRDMKAVLRPCGCKSDQLGRAGRVPGTRELVIPKTPLSFRIA